MKLLYLTNSRIPGEKAHAIQIMRTCAALAAHGDVCLVHAHRRNRPWLRNIRDLKAYYGLPRDVPRRAIPSIDLFDIVLRLPFGRLRAYQAVFAIQLLSYHLALIPFLLTNQAAAYYTRDSLTAALLAVLKARTRRQVFFEAHAFPSSALGLRLQRWLLPRLGGIVVLTQPLADRYVELGCSADQISVVPDAVDVSSFARLSRAAARQRLGIAAQDFIVMYVGQLYTWKGVDVLVTAAAELPEPCQVWLVGGTPEERPRVEQLVRDTAADNVKLVGYVRPTEVPHYLVAADVLALPNTGTADISRYYTSPLKLFEYLAAGRPIVASDLPSLKEILTDGETALLVEPDDVRALAQGILRLRDDPRLAKRLAAQARQMATTYTWERRADRILEFVQRRLETRVVLGSTR